MAAIFPARIALSTTGGSGQHAANGDVLERTEVQIVNHRPSFAFGKCPVIVFGQNQTVAKDAIRKGRGRFVQEDQVDAPSGRLLEVRDESACPNGVERRTLRETDGNVKIALVMTGPAGGRAEQQGIRDAWIPIEDGAKRVHGSHYNR